MKRYRATYKSKSGLMYVALLAKDREDAKQQAAAYQARRHARFPLTFGRLEQSLETGELHPMLAADPKMQAFIKAGGDPKPFVKAEIERRKRDLARYEENDLKLVKIEEQN